MAVLTLITPNRRGPASASRSLVGVPTTSCPACPLTAAASAYPEGGPATGCCLPARRCALAAGATTGANGPPEGTNVIADIHEYRHCP